MRRVLTILTAAGLVGPAAASADTWRVGSGEAHGSIGAGLARAAAGDTVVVTAGTYRERLVIERRVTLIGEGWPVIDGGGEGHVIEALAPLEIRGFVIRGSGTDVDREDAGVMARSGPAVIEGNLLEDVFYGIYLKRAPGSLISGNTIVGKVFEARPRRGDGIRLWYSARTTIEGNRLHRVRDLVVYFSDSLRMRDNEVRDGRYGLHYMYSNYSRVEGNRLVGCEVGAFLMYSKELTVEGNAFVDAAGASGIGLGLKDTDAATVVSNLFLENVIGVYLDNSPPSVAGVNRFAGNAFVRNGSGVRLLPAVRGNAFEANDFLGNLRPAEVAGGVRRGQEGQNDWDGNHWSEHAGFDRDGDGRGDQPFVHARLSDHLTSKWPALRLYALSPALGALDLVSRFFPLLRPEPVVVDEAPRIAPVAIGRWRDAAVVGRGLGSPARRAGVGAMWALGALASVAFLRRATRGGRR